MRVAALYDVHAMPWALEPVLAEVAELGVDAIVFGGDFVGGPSAAVTLELIRTVDGTMIRGNAERDVDDDQLTHDQQAELKALPLSVRFDEVLYCHATPSAEDPITTAITPDDEITELFAGIEGTVVIGHTHHQFDRRVGGLRLVNAGSVGMAYESHVAAYWALVVDGEPELRHTELDLDRLAAGILASGWPQAEEFVAENVRVAIDRDEAIRYFEGRR
ncbi:MAG: metallophosphoesterase family protein [Actinobacteria bacterium]|nr:metallophosphoesterase family protein [Actinomycetota bacterium]